MRIQPKSPEVIEAQLAAFSTEAVPDRHNAAYLLGNISTIAATSPQEIHRTTEHAEIPLDEQGFKQRHLAVPEGTVVKAADRADYVGFLRGVQGREYGPIRERATLLERYKAFEPSITSLVESVEGHDDRENHAAYKGSGSSRSAYSFEQEGKQYILRLQRYDGSSQQSNVIDDDMRTYIQAKGLARFEQVAATSYKKGHFVTEAFPGKDFKHVDAQQVEQQATPEQFDDMVDALTQASKRGIKVDPKASNYMYDPENGFNMIDYGTSDAPLEELLIENLVMSAVGLANMGDAKEIPDTFEEHAHKRDQLTAALALTRAYTTALTRSITNKPLRERIVDSIKEQLQSSYDHLDKLRDKQWVAGEVDRQQRFLAKVAAHRATPRATDTEPTFTSVPLEIME